jgi:hypothetical protein
MRAIAWNLYDFKKYQETETYKELDRADKMAVDRIIFNWKRNDFY